jgi:hypothetical protein
MECRKILRAVSLKQSPKLSAHLSQCPKCKKALDVMEVISRIPGKERREKFIRVLLQMFLGEIKPDLDDIRTVLVYADDSPAACVDHPGYSNRSSQTTELILDLKMVLELEDDI